MDRKEYMLVVILIMKNKFKIYALIFFVCVSCSSDDSTKQDNSNSYKEAIIKVEIINSNEFVDFEESIGFQIVANNAAKVELSGETWNTIENLDNVIKRFSRTGDMITNKRIFVTSQKVKSLTITDVLTPKINDSDFQSILETTVKIYADDKLIKTETFTSTYDKSNAFTIPVVVEEDL
jgi:hypothetical protein